MLHIVGNAKKTNLSFNKTLYCNFICSIHYTRQVTTFIYSPISKFEATEGLTVWFFKR